MVMAIASCSETSSDVNSQPGTEHAKTTMFLYVCFLNELELCLCFSHSNGFFIKEQPLRCLHRL